MLFLARMVLRIALFLDNPTSRGICRFRNERSNHACKCLYLWRECEVNIYINILKNITESIEFSQKLTFCYTYINRSQVTL